MMPIIRAAINRPVAVTMFYAGVVLLGVLCVFFLPVELLPNVSFRHITIEVPVRGGMPPDEIERLIIEPIEEAVSSVSNVSKMDSVAKVGLATVVLSFSPETDMDLAALEVREKFTRVKDKLPREIDKPVVAKFQQSDIPILIVALTSEKHSVEKLRDLVETQIKDKFLQLAGVANVEVSGGRERKILVEPNLEQLNAAQLSLGEVVDAINRNNLNLVVGEWREGEKNILVRGKSTFEKLQELENLVVAHPSPGALIRLKDVAQVKDSYNDPQSYSRMNSESVVTLYVQKESQANTMRVCQLLKAEIARFQEKHKQEIQFLVVSDQSLFIAEALRQVRNSLLMGAFLAMGILYFFLRALPPTLLLGATLFLAVLATFPLMFALGISLNVMSLSGLALSVGMLVDNAILVLENILKKRKTILDPLASSLAGTQEVWLALLASTLTTIIVFVPLIYLDAQLRLLYSGLALTVTFSLLASLLIAVTFIPSFLPRLNFSLEFSIKNPLARLEEKYVSLLKKVLSRPGKVLASIAILFAGALGLLFTIETELSGNPDQGKFTLFVELPSGAKLEVSDRVVHEVESYLSALREVETVSSRVEGSSSKVFVSLVPEEERKLSTLQVMDRLRPKLREFGRAQRAFCYFSEVQSSKGAEVSFLVFGEDPVVLKAVGSEVGKEMGEIAGMGEIKLRYKEGRPELTLVVDRDKAALHHISPQEIAEALHAQLRGLEATKFHTETREVDTIVRLPEMDRATQEKIKQLFFVTPQGDRVALAELVRFEDRKAPNEIWRRSKERVMEVSASSFELSVGKALELMQKKLIDKKWPKGYFVQPNEEYFAQKRHFSQMLLALVLTVVLIYMLLASIFESYLQPLFVMVSVPLAVIGVSPLLVLAGKPITIGVLVGGILLAGIVVNNAIVLIEAFNHLRQADRNFNEALEEAGRERLQPIAMTTLTTLLGLVPMAFFSSRSEILWSPLALTVMGGLAASAFLSLFVIPLFLKMGERVAAGPLTQK